MAWLHVNTRSGAANVFLGFDVLMPQYDESGAQGPARKGPYPVLFLLHPQGAQSIDWMTKTMLQTRVERLPLAVVMPSCFNSFWVNMARGREYGDMLIHELPSVYSTLYNISAKREDTYIAGAGMGGYGAIWAALTAPGRFGFAASIGGDLDPARLYKDGFSVSPQDIFGPREAFAGSGRDLLSLAEKTRCGPPVRLFSDPGDVSHGENLKFYEKAANSGMDIKLMPARAPRAGGWQGLDLCLGQLLAALPAGSEG